MTFFDILLLGVSLSMDAFAVSICKGLSMKKLDLRKAVIIGLYFGFFQAFMPLIGYFFGSIFQNLITSIDHWIAFLLLGFIGFNMIKESFSNDDSENLNDSVDFKTMIVLAIATSIDALAVGITFSFLEVNILFSILLIGITTFLFSFIGVFVGNKFGSKFKNKAEAIGGIVLIIIGLKILLEHLGII
jgi:putative Mn2+ efflux pump MntP